MDFTANMTYMFIFWNNVIITPFIKKIGNNHKILTDCLTSNIFLIKAWISSRLAWNCSRVWKKNQNEFWWDTFPERCFRKEWKLHAYYFMIIKCSRYFHLHFGYVIVSPSYGVWNLSPLRDPDDRKLTRNTWSPKAERNKKIINTQQLEKRLEKKLTVSTNSNFFRSCTSWIKQTYSKPALIKSRRSNSKEASACNNK